MPKRITSVVWQASNIPPGLAFDSHTGKFSGTPTAAEDFTVPVTVITNYGTDTKDVAISVEAKGAWKEMTGPDGIMLQDCVDNGEDIIFFGNATNNNRSNGVFLTYNPKNNTYSDVYNLIDGEIYSGETNATNYEYSFKACAQDPVSKKWLAFFGTHYIRTPTATKDLGADVDFYQITVCWANSLQKFCVIGQSSSNKFTSYLFDIDGNLLDKSTDINSISGFKLYSSFSRYRSHDMHICWSDTENKFVVICDATKLAVYSSDGLNWTSMTLSGGSAHYYRLIYRIESLGLFIALSGYGDSLSSGTRILTSSDGITWTQINSLAFTAYKIAWSESKKTLCLVGYYRQSEKHYSFISTDLVNWEKTSMPIAVSENGGLIWSDTANAFIAPCGETNKFIRLKL